MLGGLIIVNSEQRILITITCDTYPIKEMKYEKKLVPEALKVLQ